VMMVTGGGETLFASAEIAARTYGRQMQTLLEVLETIPH